MKKEAVPQEAYDWIAEQYLVCIGKVAEPVEVRTIYKLAKDKSKFLVAAFAAESKEEKPSIKGLLKKFESALNPVKKPGDPAEIWKREFCLFYFGKEPHEIPEELIEAKRQENADKALKLLQDFKLGNL